MNPSAGLIDELHRQPDDSLVNVVRLSTAARAQPMVIYLTTADEDRESVCNETLARAKDVRDNPGDPTRPGFDPEFLPAVFEADVKDDWTQPTVSAWKRSGTTRAGDCCQFRHRPAQCVTTPRALSTASVSSSGPKDWGSRWMRSRRFWTSPTVAIAVPCVP